MAWGKVVSLKVGIGDPGIEGNATELGDLDIEFEVRRSRVYQDNHAKFRIYNVSPEVRKKYLVAGSTVVFGAGYEDENAHLKTDGIQAPTIFWGYVSVSSTKPDGPDTVTTLDCKIALGLHEAATTKTTKNKKTGVSKTRVVKGEIAAVDRVFLEVNYAPKTTYRTILSDLCDQLDLVLINPDLLAGIVAVNGFKAQGSFTGIIARIKAVLEDNGISAYEEANDGLVLYKLGAKADTKQQLSAVELNYESGLLGLEELENEIITPSAAERSSWHLKEDERQLILKKIRFTTLLNPDIKPNVGVLINIDTLRETYIVDAVEYKGDNRGGEFNLVGQGVG